MPARWLLAVVLLGLAPGLAGQSPEQRQVLDALRDSFAIVDDTAALRRLEAAAIAVAKRDRDDPMIHLRLGFIAFRLGERSGANQHYEDAAGEFEWAAELRPDWPYPWYALGRAELALGEHSVIAIENLRQQLGKDYLSKAARAFARAALADPGFGRAAIDLANTALGQRIRPRLDVALEAVRLAARAAGDRPDVQLARGRVEREVGDPDSARAAFLAYVAAGGDSGLGLLELSRTDFLLRRAAAGARAYFAGVAAARSPEAAALYRADLVWVAGPAELAGFDSLNSPEARRAWLTAFWERRDWEEAWRPGERLAEHYRRWFYARRQFRLVSRHRRYDITEVYRSDQVEFDDRGVVYLRHGEPDRRAAFSREDLEPNLSWLYRRPDGDLVFHFVARDDVQDYRLVESLADVLGFGRAVRAQARQDADLVELYGSRVEFGPAYQRVASGTGVPARVLAEERAAGRRNIGIGTLRDSYRRYFPTPLPVVWSDFVTGAGSAETEPQRLHVVFAIPAKHLIPKPDGVGVVYPLRFRLVVADAAADAVVADLDTVRVFGAPAALPGASFLTGRLDVPVPAGPARYRMLVSTIDDGAGTVLGRDTLDVPRLDGREFAMSDLVVGRVGSGLRWFTGRDTVALNPLDQFPTGGVVELYYEVYGLEAARPYHTVVRLEKRAGGSIFSALRRVFGGRRSPLRLEFDAVADGPVMRLHRAVDLRDTPRGTYTVSLTLTDPATGRTLRRTRTFEVVSAP